jgi:hypothetical protein
MSALKEGINFGSKREFITRLSMLCSQPIIMVGIREKESEKLLGSLD